MSDIQAAVEKGIVTGDVEIKIKKKLSLQTNRKDKNVKSSFERLNPELIMLF